MARGRLMILKEDGTYETYRGQAVAVFKIVAESDLECVYATFTTEAEAQKYFQQCVDFARGLGLEIYDGKA